MYIQVYILLIKNTQVTTVSDAYTHSIQHVNVRLYSKNIRIDRGRREKKERERNEISDTERGGDGRIWSGKIVLFPPIPVSETQL
mmetsp:Transcript_5613/g.8582  ORF Transcript_5613/g.8582 Transcript_5613/m.8582 type:complete len:85 (+) Transcript_5613:520-774(+)